MNFVRQMLAKEKVAPADMRKASADFFCDPDHPAIDEITEMRLEVINRPGMLTKERAHASRQVERGRANYQASDLMRIEAPCNLIHGRDEKFFFTREEAPVLLECAIKPCLVIPDCNCTVLAQCGHWPQTEKAETFNALSLEFLKHADRH
jgi:pimeloyl-ACP methyl ester carboxylesterase